MNHWSKPETYLAAGSVGLAAFIATPFAATMPQWTFSILVAALPILQLLSGNKTEAKALATLPPLKVDKL